MSCARSASNDPGGSGLASTARQRISSYATPACSGVCAGVGTASARATCTHDIASDTIKIGNSAHRMAITDAYSGFSSFPVGNQTFGGDARATVTAVEAGASLREVTILVIGIIGSGKIGSTVARLAVGAGHDVVISNSRGPDSLSDLVASLGPHARAATVAQAVREGDIVVIAIPFRSRATLFGSGVDFRGKIVVDAMNAYTENFEPMDLGGKGSSELVAQELPGARVVKAFNTLYSKTLASAAQPKGSPERIVLPIASDDADAKRVVAGFIDSIGYEPFDDGSLVDGRRQQPETALYNVSVSASEAKTLVATR